MAGRSSRQRTLHIFSHCAPYYSCYMLAVHHWQVHKLVKTDWLRMDLLDMGTGHNPEKYHWLRYHRDQRHTSRSGHLLRERTIMLVFCHYFTSSCMVWHSNTLPVVLCWQSMHMPLSGWQTCEWLWHSHATHVSYAPPKGVARVYPGAHTSQNWPVYSDGQIQFSTLEAFFTCAWGKDEVLLLNCILISAILEYNLGSLRVFHWARIWSDFKLLRTRIIS